MTSRSLRHPFLSSNVKKKLLLELQPGSIDSFLYILPRKINLFFSSELPCCSPHPSGCSSVYLKRARYPSWSLLLHTYQGSLPSPQTLKFSVPLLEQLLSSLHKQIAVRFAPLCFSSCLSRILSPYIPFNCIKFFPCLLQGLSSLPG